MTSLGVTVQIKVYVSSCLLLFGSMLIIAKPSSGQSAEKA
jgi:hypothetical protein